MRLHQKAYPGYSGNILPLAALVAVLALPLFERDPYILHVIILVFFYVMYSSSWNLLAYSGQVSFGHAAFLGIGGYITTLLAIRMVSPWLGLLAGASASALVGCLIGLTCVRLREWFLALVTFGFSLIMEAITIQLDWITAGTFGLAVPSLLNSLDQYYYGMLSLMVVTVLLTYLIIRSKIGLAFIAIRENEQEAKATGIDTVKYKLLAFVISTFLTGLAGAFYAHFIGFINPQIYSLEHSFWPVIMVVSGGLGTLEGPVIGTVVIMFVWEFLRIIDPVQRMLTIGLILILIIIFMPRGLSLFLRKYLQTLTPTKLPTRKTGR